MLLAKIDIRRVLEPLNPHNVALHDQKGQKPDVGQYLESVVHSDRTTRNWPEELKILVIDTLAKNSGGSK